jgi:hypothetical protein
MEQREHLTQRSSRIVKDSNVQSIYWKGMPASPEGIFLLINRSGALEFQEGMKCPLF